MRTSMRYQAIQLLSILLLFGIPYLLWIGQGSAQQLNYRNVTINDATPSAVTIYNFQLTPASVDPVGSMVFEFCANSPLFDVGCVAPSGLALGSAVFGTQTGNTGFSIDNIDSTANRLVISRVAAPMITDPSSYTFGNITNPSTPNQTVYVKISTYLSTQGTGSSIDKGAVAFSTASNFVVGAYVPPFLNLCVGITVTDNCTQTNGDSINLGDLSTKSASAGSSQFAVSTNDSNGCNIYVLGTTMTSGNNELPALNSPQASQPGISQFGLNLRKNSNPIVGLDSSGAGSNVVEGLYASPNLFSFVPGSLVAHSPVSTDYNRMTVSYLVNISATQPAGVYSTTLTYLGSAQF